MASVSFKSVTKRYDTFEAVIDLNLDVQDGEFLVLVGPSGCGKTTTLRMLAGLESVTEGEISIGDREVNDVQPKDRDIAMVFQSYALYPHMSVRANIEYPLRLAASAGRNASSGCTQWRRCCGSRSNSTRSPASCPVDSGSEWRWVGRWCASRRSS